MKFLILECDACVCFKVGKEILRLNKEILRFNKEILRFNKEILRFIRNFRTKFMIPFSYI